MDKRSVNSGFQQMDWVELGVSADHHKLFILQWFELFADDSLDTWQVRTSNVLSLLREVEETIEVSISDYGPAQAALPDLVKEALNSIDRDLVVKKHFPFVRAALEELGSQLQSTSAQQKALESIGRRARVVREAVQRTYRGLLIADLRELLMADGKRREDQLNLTMSLATELAAAGFSTHHLRAVRELLCEPKAPFAERFDALRSTSW